MILVDTGAWFALSVPSDSDHRAATNFARTNRDVLVTTDYIVDELLTLFRVRREPNRAIAWLDRILFAERCNLVRIELVDFQRAIDVYRAFADKNWSFTDCTSLAVMERLGIDKAFAFDEHFRQFGSISVLPS
jgi:predicted nucleic acid-binding protein